MNVQFEYLYRDAGNNKQFGAVIFSGENVKNLDAISLEIQKHLIDDMFFVAREIGIPPLAFVDYDVDLDHDWHEYLGVSWTDIPADVGDDLDIFGFIQLMSLSKKSHDQLFGKRG